MSLQDEVEPDSSVVGVLAQAGAEVPPALGVRVT
jgi:hypothetical protein